MRIRSKSTVKKVILSFLKVFSSIKICNLFLFQATKSPFYLHVGRDILESLNHFTRTECGYATVHNVFDMSLEDRMESFFLSETAKYLYLVSASVFLLENIFLKVCIKY